MRACLVPEKTRLAKGLVLLEELRHERLQIAAGIEDDSVASLHHHSRPRPWSDITRDQTYLGST
jgi:hypothetical protein